MPAIKYCASWRFEPLSCGANDMDVVCRSCGKVFCVDRDDEGTPEYPKDHVCSDIASDESPACRLSPSSRGSDLNAVSQESISA